MRPMSQELSFLGTEQGVTPVVSKTSTGAVEHIPIARVTNLSQTLDKLKEEGFWIFGTDMNGTAISSVEYGWQVSLDHWQ